MKLLEDHHALVTHTHVVFTSGRHGDTYINKDAIYLDTAGVSRLCEGIAMEFSGSQIDVVAAPAVGGVALAQWTAHHLSQRISPPVLAVYAEKQPDRSFAFRRGYDAILEERRVLVVEDVLTTGASVRAVVEAARACSGNVVGVAAICNRGRVTAADVGSPERFIALAELPLDSWDEASCPLCAQGVPVNTSVGKGREFLARHQQSHTGLAGGVGLVLAS
jgi:orotate phosphoribosyltransferase